MIRQDCVPDGSVDYNLPLSLWCAGGPIPGVHGPANDGETEGDSGEGWCPLVRLGRVPRVALRIPGVLAEASFQPFSQGESSPPNVNR